MTTSEAEALTAMRKLADEGNIAGLMALLKDPAVAESRGARFSTLIALAEIGDPASAPAFIDALHGDDRMAYLAAKQLGAWKLAESVRPLIDVLTTGSPKTRAMAAESLGRIGQTDSVLALCQAVGDDPDWLVRGSAADALGLIGDDQATQALAKALRDPHRLVRDAAADAVVSTGGRDGLAALDQAISERRGLMRTRFVPSSRRQAPPLRCSRAAVGARRTPCASTRGRICSARC